MTKSRQQCRSKQTNTVGEHQNLASFAAFRQKIVYPSGSCLPSDRFPRNISHLNDSDSMNALLEPVAEIVCGRRMRVKAVSTIKFISTAITFSLFEHNETPIVVIVVNCNVQVRSLTRWKRCTINTSAAHCFCQNLWLLLLFHRFKKVRVAHGLKYF